MGSTGRSGCFTLRRRKPGDHFFRLLLSAIGTHELFSSLPHLLKSFKNLFTFSTSIFVDRHRSLLIYKMTCSVSVIREPSIFNLNLSLNLHLGSYYFIPCIRDSFLNPIRGDLPCIIKPDLPFGKVYLNIFDPFQLSERLRNRHHTMLATHSFYLYNRSHNFSPSVPTRPQGLRLSFRGLAEPLCAMLYALCVFLITPSRYILTWLSGNLSRYRPF